MYHSCSVKFHHSNFDTLYESILPDLFTVNANQLTSLAEASLVALLIVANNRPNNRSMCLYLCDCLHPAFGCQFTINVML